MSYHIAFTPSDPGPLNSQQNFVPPDSPPWVRLACKHFNFESYRVKEIVTVGDTWLINVYSHRLSGVIYVPKAKAPPSTPGVHISELPNVDECEPTFSTRGLDFHLGSGDLYLGDGGVYFFERELGLRKIDLQTFKFRSVYLPSESRIINCCSLETGAGKTLFALEDESHTLYWGFGGERKGVAPGDEAGEDEPELKSFRFQLEGVGNVSQIIGIGDLLWVRTLTSVETQFLNQIHVYQFVNDSLVLRATAKTPRPEKFLYLRKSANQIRALCGPFAFLSELWEEYKGEKTIEAFLLRLVES